MQLEKSINRNNFNVTRDALNNLPRLEAHIQSWYVPRR